MPLPPYYLEVIITGGVACIVIVLMNGCGVLQVLFVSFTQGLGGFHYIFIISGEVTTLEPIYGPILLTIGSLSLGETSRFLIILIPLKWVCMA